MSNNENNSTTRTPLWNRDKKGQGQTQFVGVGTYDDIEERQFAQQNRHQLREYMKLRPRHEQNQMPNGNVTHSPVQHIQEPRSSQQSPNQQTHPPQRRNLVEKRYHDQQNYKATPSKADDRESNPYIDKLQGSSGFADADAKKRRGRAAPPGRCHSCNRAQTPEWRRGPDGPRTLCNACGLRMCIPHLSDVEIADCVQITQS